MKEKHFMRRCVQTSDCWCKRAAKLKRKQRENQNAAQCGSPSWQHCHFEQQLSTYKHRGVNISICGGQPEVLIYIWEVFLHNFSASPRVQMKASREQPSIIGEHLYHNLSTCLSSSCCGAPLKNKGINCELFLVSHLSLVKVSSKLLEELFQQTASSRSETFSLIATTTKKSGRLNKCKKSKWKVYTANLWHLGLWSQVRAHHKNLHFAWWQIQSKSHGAL